ncbi:nickel pincer cofactor biosynthesis protein LarC [Thalassoglobus sp. JC818]|uniref:nickel pincer cofactor biosynthesis protein LarC n=1 Tax=Thalassoglobus sp. JC818 TaxID=3232136 RepID=UPI00345A1905
MKVAYLQCGTGISGDMTLAALIDAGIDQEKLQSAIQSLRLPGVNLVVSEVMKGCFRARHIRVEHPEQHAHRHYSDIVQILNQADGLSDKQRSLAQSIFLQVAKAEAQVHGTDVESIHFHEVGAIDSIVDIVGAAVGFDLLGCDQIHCSPIPPGRGQVNIDHGLCDVPTPGTAELLKGIPLIDVPIEAELTTPTGAAIVKTLVDQFGPLPSMTIQSIGYGAGTMNFESRANLLRLFVGTVSVPAGTDEVCLLETNLDDISGEVIAHTMQRLLEAGAKDVYSIPIQMKKGRPATMLCVLADPLHQEKMEEILFAETGTLGIRQQRILRSTLARQAHTVLTDLGPILGKVAWHRTGVPSFSPEFEDCARIAKEHSIPIREVYRSAITAFDAQSIGSSPEQVSPKHSHLPAKDHTTHDHDHHGHDHDHDHHRHDHDHHGHDHG